MKPYPTSVSTHCYCLNFLSTAAAWLSLRLVSRIYYGQKRTVQENWSHTQTLNAQNLSRMTHYALKMASKWMSSYSCQELSMDFNANSRPILALTNQPAGPQVNYVFKKKKSRIRETKNLSTDADRRTDTILERLLLGKKKNNKIKN